MREVRSRSRSGDVLFVVIEGADGTGKSTLGETLSKHAGVVLVRNPPQVMEPVRQAIYEGDSPTSSFLYFMAGNAQVSDSVSSLNQRTTALCVRYLWSTIAYHLALGGITEAEARGFAGTLCERFLLPNLLILLKAGTEERERRLGERSEPEFQTRLGADREFQGRVAEGYEFALGLLQVPAFEIDTSGSPPSATARLALDAIQRLVGKVQ